MGTGKATHIRLKSGSKVNVERIQGTLVVRSMKGAVIGSYGPDDMAKFHKRYQTLTKTASHQRGK